MICKYIWNNYSEAWYSPNGIVHVYKKKWNVAVYYHLDGTGKHNVERNKSEEGKYQIILPVYDTCRKKGTRQYEMIIEPLLKKKAYQAVEGQENIKSGPEVI